MTLTTTGTANPDKKNSTVCHAGEAQEVEQREDPYAKREPERREQSSAPAHVRAESRHRAPEPDERERRRREPRGPTRAPPEVDVAGPPRPHEGKEQGEELARAHGFYVLYRDHVGDMSDLP
jgi:hypothetical protein